MAEGCSRLRRHELVSAMRNDDGAARMCTGWEKTFWTRGRAKMRMRWPPRSPRGHHDARRAGARDDPGGARRGGKKTGAATTASQAHARWAHGWPKASDFGLAAMQSKKRGTHRRRALRSGPVVWEDLGGRFVWEKREGESAVWGEGQAAFLLWRLIAGGCACGQCVCVCVCVVCGVSVCAWVRGGTRPGTSTPCSLPYCTWRLPSYHHTWRATRLGFGGTVRARQVPFVVPVVAGSPWLLPLDRVHVKVLVGYAPGGGGLRTSQVALQSCCSAPFPT